MIKRVIVPLKPTPKMIKAGADTGCFVAGDEDAREWLWEQHAETVWKAMLAAAPKATGALRP